MQCTSLTSQAISRILSIHSLMSLDQWSVVTSLTGVLSQYCASRSGSCGALKGPCKCACPCCGQHPQATPLVRRGSKSAAGFMNVVESPGFITKIEIWNFSHFKAYYQPGILAETKDRACKYLTSAAGLTCCCILQFLLPAHHRHRTLSSHSQV